MKIPIYICIYLTISVFMSWKIVESLYLISTTVTQGSAIAQLKREQKQLALHKQELQQQVTYSTALAVISQHDTQAFIPITKFITITQPSSLAMGRYQQ